MDNPLLAESSSVNLTGMRSTTSHKVFAELPFDYLRVQKKDIVFYIYRGGKRSSAKFGELRISQGALVWRAKGDKIGRKLNWSRLAKVMEEEGHRSEKRRQGTPRSVPRSRRT